MSKRVFDAAFKKMAIELSYARGSVKEVAEELGIDAGRISKWRQQHSLREKSPVGLTDEQKELKESLLERDMDPMLTHVCGSKKAISIFSKGGGPYSDL